MGTAQKVRSKLYCNNCRRSVAHKRDLDERWLCVECRVLPGVRGYQDPNKRGLQSGSLAYWEATKGQLTVVGDDEPVARAPAAPSHQRRVTVERIDEVSGEITVEFDGPEPPEQLGGTLKSWRKDVFAAKQSSDRKVLCLALAEWAQWSGPTEGGNVFPSVSEVAKKLGWARTRVHRTIQEVRGAWITVVEVEAVNEKTGDIIRLSNHYTLRWPDGRRLSGYDKRTA